MVFLASPLFWISFLASSSAFLACSVPSLTPSSAFLVPSSISLRAWLVASVTSSLLLLPQPDQTAPPATIARIAKAALSARSLVLFGDWSFN